MSDPTFDLQRPALPACATSKAAGPRVRPDDAPAIRPMMPLGQFRDTFIIAVDEEGIAIIDQHVAHERVLFERITERLTTGRLESQRLLDADAGGAAGRRRARRCVAHAADLERLGFELEEFGGDAVRVSAFPALLRPRGMRRRAAGARRGSRRARSRRDGRPTR